MARAVSLGLTLGAEQHVVVLELELLGLREACHGLLEGEHAATDAATMAGVASDPPQVEGADVRDTESLLGLPDRGHHRCGGQHARLAAAGAQDGQALCGFDTTGPVATRGAGDGLGGGLDRRGGTALAGAVLSGESRGEDARRRLRPGGLGHELEVAGLREQTREADETGLEAQLDGVLRSGLHHCDDFRTGARDAQGAQAVLAHQHVAGEVDDDLRLNAVVHLNAVDAAVHRVGLLVVVAVVVLEAFQEGGLLVDDFHVDVGLELVEGREVVPGPGDEVLTVGDVLGGDVGPTIVVLPHLGLDGAVEVEVALDVAERPRLQVGAVGVAVGDDETGSVVAEGTGHEGFSCGRHRRPTCCGVPLLGEHGKVGGGEGRWMSQTRLMAGGACSILEDVAQSAER